MILRELLVRLGLSVDEQSFAKGELAAKTVERAVDKIVETAHEVVRAFVEQIKATAEAGKEIEEMAQATGLTTDSLQQLRGVARAAGVATEDLDTGIFKLSRSMYAAKKGGEEQAKVFDKLKVRYKEHNGELRNADDVMLGLANAFQKMPDGAEKTAMAMELLGRGGAKMIPMLNLGEEGINKLRASVFVMTEEQIKAGKELVDTNRQLGNVTRGIWRSAIGPMLPAINALLKRYLAWQKANAGLIKQQIQKYIGYAIKGVKLLGDGFSFVQKNSELVKVALGSLAIAFALMNAAAVGAAVKTGIAWGLAMLPFVALAAIVGGIFLLFDDLRVYQEDQAKGSKKQHSLYGTFKKEIDKWLEPNANDPWWLAAIKDFVRWLKEALELLQQFDEATARYNPQTLDKRAAVSGKEQRRQTDVITQRTARKRVSLGLPLTDEERAALTRSGVTPEQFTSKYAPGPYSDVAPGPYAPMAPAAAPSTSVVIHSSPKISVATHPGQSNDEIAEKVMTKVRGERQAELEAAHAALSGD